MLNVNRDEVLGALDKLGGTATCHEVVTELGYNSSWQREKVFTILSDRCEKIPLSELTREYSVGGGAAKWAYRLTESSW